MCFIAFLCVLALGFFSGNGLAMEGRLMRQPDIFENHIVFVFENDLWKVSLDDLRAVRLTSHPGIEAFPKFSPDGNWIAFTGAYDGGKDIYILPTQGGEPKRLTVHPEPDEVVEWFPSGEKILFRSPRTVESQVYQVSIRGGFQPSLPIDRIRHASFSPDGTQLVFTRSDADAMHWRGYKGGAQSDLWLVDLKTWHFEKITDYPGNDTHPMWYGNEIYFLSDRKNLRMNLYAYSLQDHSVTQKTFHEDWDVEDPSLGGNRIVYVCEGSLWIYDIPTGKNERLVIDIPSDRWLTRNSFIDPSEYLQELRLNHDGKKAIAVARGDVYLLDDQNVVNLTKTPAFFETGATISPDGKWVAFFSDRNVPYTLYLVSLEKPEAWIPLAVISDAWPYHLEWSPDSKKLLFGDSAYRLFWIDIKKKELVKIDSTQFQKDNEFYWEISEYEWSPDSRWIVYSKCEANMNSSIFLYHLDSKTITRLTNDRYDDTSPVFSKDGKYLFFLSLRHFEPLLDPFLDNHINGNMSEILGIQLQKGKPFPFQKPLEKQEKEEEKKEPAQIHIDLEGISDRIFRVPVPPGTYKRLKTGQNAIFYLSREQFGFPGWEEFVQPKSVTDYVLFRFDFDTQRTEEVISGIGHYEISYDRNHIAYISGNLAGIIEATHENAPGDGLLDWHGFRQAIDYHQEYLQIFHTAWNQIRCFFYDPQLHGVNWEKVKKQYESLIPYTATRSDLNYLIGKMIGEVGASHEYILSTGDETRHPKDRKISVGLLGADVEPDSVSGVYCFRRILKGQSWDPEARGPLAGPEVEIRPGDFLLSIDGNRVSSQEDYLIHLIDKAGKKVRIAVNSKPDTNGQKIVEIETLHSEWPLRQLDWVEQNYQKVRSETNGKVGYIYLSDMDEQGFQEFEQGFRAERYRDALIVDVRGNSGGFISWFLVDKLERRPVFYTKTRHFEPMTYPHGAHPGPLVVLCDENTGSDGEIFVQHVQKLGLGPVVGVETWGGLIGIINTIPTADGGLITQSNVGFFDPLTGWIVENKGAHPDVRVENGPGDAPRGKDPQLEQAIALALKLLSASSVKENVPPFPKVNQ